MTACPMQFEAAFRGETAAVPEARTFTCEVLGEVVHLPADLVEDAELAISELVTNALSHTASGRADGKVRVRLEVTDSHVDAEVVDEGGTTAPAIHAAADGEEHGRGLFICESLGDLYDLPATVGPGRRVGVRLTRTDAPRPRLEVR